MKVYYAGNAGYIEREQAWLDLIVTRLVSYHFVKEDLFNSFACFDLVREKMKRKNQVDLFLDSGAFSAFSQNITIDIYEYIDFIKEHMEYIEVYANLDVIGDAKGTLKNQRIMEAAGLKPLPCFHRGEDFKYLQYYLDRHDYIALGGVAQTKNPNLLMRWLDRCFSMICDDKGMPKVKVHGFAITSLKLMMRYPWYSVDSTSWVVGSRMGTIFVPRFRGGKYVYDENSWKISVSNRSPSQRQEAKHITTFSPAAREVVMNYIEEKGYTLGVSEFRQEDENYELKEGERWFGKEEADTQRQLNIPVVRGWSKDYIVETMVEPGLSNNYVQRDEMNIIYFKDLEEYLPDWPWAFQYYEDKSLGIG